MIRRLIVSADDLGVHEEINRGILEAHEEGIVTSASIVPCGRAFDHARRLVQKKRKLDVGIHLTLVEERPLLGSEEIRTLAPKGLLPKTYRQLFVGIVKGRIHLSDIERELDAQIRKVLEAGLRPSHLDSHQHTHLFPPLKAMFLRLALHYDFKHVRAASRIVPGRTKFSLLLSSLARGLHRAARKRGISTVDTLWLPSPSGHLTGRKIVEGIPGLLPGVTELVVHPGADQKALDRAYPDWGFKWQQELAALKATDARDALSRANVQLTRYSELP